jgi:hypothetical protein
MRSHLFRAIDADPNLCNDVGTYGEAGGGKGG